MTTTQDFHDIVNYASRLGHRVELIEGVVSQDVLIGSVTCLLVEARPNVYRVVPCVARIHNVFEFEPEQFLTKSEVLSFISRLPKEG